METLVHLIDQTAQRMKEKDGILFMNRGRLESKITYASLKKVTHRVARGLIEMGLRKEDRVILFMPKSIEQVVFHLGIQKVGAISVILNPGFKREEMEYFIRDADPRLLIVGKNEESLIRSIDEKRPIIPVETDTPFFEGKLFPSGSLELTQPEGIPDDAAVLIYTSGTTGHPKGAILTQENLVRDAMNIIQIWEISEQDILCHALPLFHVHGLCFGLHTALVAGATVVMCNEFSPDTVIDVLSRQDGEVRCTIFMGVPAMYLRMIEKVEGARVNFGHIRLFASGSAPLLPKDFARIKRVFGKEPVEREGMSETGMNFSNPLRGVKKPGSIGIPLPGVKVRIVNPENFQDVVPGEVGEIWLKGPNVSPGYWRKKRETEASFVEGWFRTGDLGKVDQEGYYTLTDRLKHIIISGGENISPKEIETVINRYEKVVESCVIGVPDERWGEKVVAAVVAKKNSALTEKEIRGYCKGRLLDWKCPKDVFFLEELPRNKMGKIIKEEVARLFKNKNP